MRHCCAGLVGVEHEVAWHGDAAVTVAPSTPVLVDQYDEPSEPTASVCVPTDASAILDSELAEFFLCMGES